jgi:hypothetical protein
MRRAALEQVDVLFFSRGRGRGHAIPDSAVCWDLKARHPRISVVMASYATGAMTLRELGWPMFDLNLPEENPLFAIIVRCGELIEGLRPKFVVSHEEFDALPAAKIFGLPTIFIVRHSVT